MHIVLQTHTLFKAIGIWIGFTARFSYTQYLSTKNSFLGNVYEIEPLLLFPFYGQENQPQKEFVVKVCFFICWPVRMYHKSDVRFYPNHHF